MTAARRFAFANARLRAMKSRLLDREDALLLRVPGAALTLVQELRHEKVRPQETFLALFPALAADYAKIAASYPVGRPLVLALLRLHEVENLKLLWRAHGRGLEPEAWVRYWRPLGKLESLRLEDAREPRSLFAVAERIAGTPYGRLAGTVLRAHGRDPQAAELAFDRWASGRILEAALGLPESESGARNLARRVVREREIDLLRRGISTYGLPAEIVLGSCELLASELLAGEFRHLADWVATGGPLDPRVQRRLQAGRANPADAGALRVALRQARREACGRELLGSPFRLGPAIAYLLLREEELHGLVALVEADGAEEARVAVDRVLQAGRMGA